MTAPAGLVEATRGYEQWMARHIPVVRPDLIKKHRVMAESAFVFLRGTFYRWIQLWPTICRSLRDAPVVAGVGDLHVENFGTWRDLEGRLVWGINDVDEACVVPYTQDLVRLATSAVLATRHGAFGLTHRETCETILEGYRQSLERGGSPFVLAERRRWLRQIALNKLRDPTRFWGKFDGLPPAATPVPRGLLRSALPDPHLSYRISRRVAGVGSLGRPRIVALALWHGALTAREAKAILPSAAVWATGRRSVAVSGRTLLARAVRAPDPYLTFHQRWIVRRLSPDCSRIELADLPKVRDETRLLSAMGAEVANLHLGRRLSGVRADLKARPRRWLERAAADMADAVEADWRQWVRHMKRQRSSRL
jgi:uncharacterized protein DUF2252